MPLEKPITEEEVQEAISKLNNNRSVGPDGIPTEWYKYGGVQVNKILSIEFNKMFANNEKMRSLTEGILIPINKPNEPRIPAKTRPIVLFNTIKENILFSDQRESPREDGEIRIAKSARISTEEKHHGTSMGSTMDESNSRKIQGILLCYHN